MFEGIDLAILTEARFVAPTESSDYIDKVMLEDQLLQDALKERGVRSQRVEWSNPNADWSQYSHAVFRATWDYFIRWDEFSPWLDRVSQCTKLINSSQLVRWNCDKHYLQELEKHSVPVVPTHFVKRGEPSSLDAIIKTIPGDEFVIKPTISGAGRDTYRLTREQAADFNAQFQKLNREADFMIQPFVPSVLDQGEVTIILFDGVVSHAIKKTAASGEFRVQEDHGGSVHRHAPLADEIAVAEKAFSVCNETPVYGRVDMVRSPDGNPWVMELELVEPELWLRFDDNAAGRYADALIKAMR